MAAVQKKPDRIDPERYYRLREIPKLLPGNIHCATVWRWTRHGVNRGGVKMRLKTRPVGGQVFVKGTDLLAFLSAEPSRKAAAVEAKESEASAELAMDELATEFGIR